MGARLTPPHERPCPGGGALSLCYHSCGLQVVTFSSSILLLFSLSLSISISRVGLLDIPLLSPYFLSLVCSLLLSFPVSRSAWRHTHVEGLLLPAPSHPVSTCTAKVNIDRGELSVGATPACHCPTHTRCQPTQTT